MKQVVWYTFLVLATLLALLLLWQARLALIIFLLSLAIAAAFRPLVDALVEKRRSRGLALFISYMLALLVIGALFFIIGGPLINDLQQAGNDLVSLYEHIATDWRNNGTSFQKAIAGQFPEPSELYSALTSEQLASVGRAVLGFAASTLEQIATILIILVLSIYWSADSVHFERLWLSFLPVDKRTPARETWRAVEQEVGAYIRGQAVQSLAAVILLWSGYWFIGLRYSALLALLAVLLRLIPWLGTALVVIPPLLVGFWGGPGLAALAALYTLAIVVGLALFVEPRFYARQHYNALFMVLVVIAMGQAMGLVGILLASPLAVAVEVLAGHLVRPPSPAYAVQAVSEIAILQERLVNVEERLTSVEALRTPERANLLERLRALLEKSSDYLER